MKYKVVGLNTTKNCPPEFFSYKSSSGFHEVPGSSSWKYNFYYYFWVKFHRISIHEYKKNMSCEKIINLSPFCVDIFHTQEYLFLIFFSFSMITTIFTSRLMSQTDLLLSLFLRFIANIGRFRPVCLFFHYRNIDNFMSRALSDPQ